MGPHARCTVECAALDIHSLEDGVCSDQTCRGVGGLVRWSDGGLVTCLDTACWVVHS